MKQAELSQTIIFIRSIPQIIIIKFRINFLVVIQISFIAQIIHFIFR